MRQPGDPPGIRDIRGQSNQEIKTSFDLKKLIGTGAAARPSRRPARRGERPGAADEGDIAKDSGAEIKVSEEEDEQSDDESADDSAARDEERPEGEVRESEAEGEGGPGFEVLLDPVLAFLRQMDAIEVRYGTKRTSRFDGVMLEDMPDWAYRLGFTEGVGADDRTEERTLSLGSGVRLVKSVRLKGNYKRTMSSRWYRNALSDTLELTSRTESMNESSKGSMTWSGIEKLGPLSGAFRSIRARSGVEYRRSYSGPYAGPLSKSRALSLSPVVSFDTTFKNGLSANFSWDKKRTRSFSLTGAGSVTEELTGSTSLSLNYRFSAPQGLKLPFFGQKLRFQSNLDTSLRLKTSSRESRTATTEDGLLLTDPTAAVQDFSVTTDATYSFSRNVSGGMQLSFSQSTDAKAERTRRTIGVHLTAEFKF